MFSETPTVFVFTGYQHIFSVAGRDSAADINLSQPRILAAVTSPQGWWLMSDFDCAVDHGTHAETFDAAFEAGRKFASDWAVSLRLIGAALDSNRRWSASLIMRHLF